MQIVTRALGILAGWWVAVSGPTDAAFERFTRALGLAGQYLTLLDMVWTVAVAVAAMVVVDALAIAAFLALRRHRRPWHPT